MGSRFLLLLMLCHLMLTACSSADRGTPTLGAGSSPGDAAKGRQLFASTCAACHGPHGEGIPGLGKSVMASDFVATRTDAELVAFIESGRSVDDPLNTTGVAMPPKGGNPALTDADLADIVAYIRSLQR
jgi:mono/diheme cytochrome c family protein